MADAPTSDVPKPGKPKRAAPHAKLTPALLERICWYLQRGHYKQDAAAMAGIHRDTLNTWEQRGRRARAERDEGVDPNPTEVVYIGLVDAVEFSLDYGEGWLMEQALDAMQNPRERRWQGYVTILERSRPDRWRRRASSEYAEKEKTPRQRLDVSKLSKAERAELRELLLKAQPDEA